jgi:hypothetical protein
VVTRTARRMDIKALEVFVFINQSFSAVTEWG